MTIATQIKRNENPEQRMVPVRNLLNLNFILLVYRCNFEDSFRGTIKSSINPLDSKEFFSVLDICS
jgi:hypothetical protein